MAVLVNSSFVVAMLVYRNSGVVGTGVAQLSIIMLLESLATTSTCDIVAATTGGCDVRRNSDSISDGGGGGLKDISRALRGGRGAGAGQTPGHWTGRGARFQLCRNAPEGHRSANRLAQMGSGYVQVF